MKAAMRLEKGRLAQLASSSTHLKQLGRVDVMIAAVATIGSRTIAPANARDFATIREVAGAESAIVELQSGDDV